MRKYIFILSLSTLFITLLSCTKDGYKTHEEVKYDIRFETNDAAVEPGGEMTIYNNTFDTTMVKIIDNLSLGSENKYSWNDIVSWERSSGVKINPDGNTKAKLLVTFRGDIMADIQGDFGEEVAFKKVYNKEEFKE